MFSELPNQPRYRYVMRRAQPIPEYRPVEQHKVLIEKISEPHNNAVLGANRLKYFHRFDISILFHYFILNE